MGPGTGQVLLGRLEHEDDATAHRSPAAEFLGGADRDGGVDVVPAEVRRTGHPGGEVAVEQLRVRDGVQVGTVGDDRAGLFTVEERDDTVSTDPGLHLQPRRRRCRGAVGAFHHHAVAGLSWR